MSINLRLSSSRNGRRNIPTSGYGGAAGGSILLEEGVFSPSPRISPSLYYVPGTGNPAISTADYYLMNGLYPMEPFDLRSAGSVGAAIEEREKARYAWPLAPDHPDGQNFQGSSDFRIAYSNDPQVFPCPSTMRQLLPYNTSQSWNDQTNFVQYHLHEMLYNPDEERFFFYTEGHFNANRQHELALFTSDELLTYTLVGPVIPTTASGGWTSFGNPVRISTGDWWTVALSNETTYRGPALYTSADGRSWTYDHQLTPNTGGPNFKNVINGSEMKPVGRYVTYQGQDYVLCIEQLSGGTVDGADTYMTLCAIDASKNFLSSPAPIRLTQAFDQSYPGPTQLQGCGAYRESGIFHFFPNRGFPTSGSQYGLVDGANYANGGGLWQQFVDRYAFVYDPIAAADAAPVGVKASCANGLVTITWDNVPAGVTRRVYKGSSAGTQATLVGDFTGTSATDSPTTGQQWWFKVVTLNGGVEAGSRVVHCYVS